VIEFLLWNDFFFFLFWLGKKYNYFWWVDELAKANKLILPGKYEENMVSYICFLSFCAV
jgi:hypothetical protein